MRGTLPVSGREHRFPAGRALVATTDANGFIRYCNPALVELSGFRRDELIGRPHALLGPVDLPTATWHDLKQTLARGRPWTATLKLRRRNGDHCWVMAQVTPLIEVGRIVGTLSVGTEPTPEQIDAAEAPGTPRSLLRSHSGVGLSK
jgi:aerotaxis receptor